MRLLPLALVTLLTACAHQPVTDFAGEKPAFRVEDFYNGHSRGYGFFFSRAGNVVKRFTADENGSWDGTTLKLHEHYLYGDNTTQDRNWMFTKTADGTWIGRTPEVVGVTTGQESGNAYRMKYRFDLSKSGSDHVVDFDDWQWRMSDKVMINRAWATKFGVEVGEIEAVFTKD
jgi:hypothetical protein